MRSALFWDVTWRNIPEQRRSHQHRSGSMKSITTDVKQKGGKRGETKEERGIHINGVHTAYRKLFWGILYS